MFYSLNMHKPEYRMDVLAKMKTGLKYQVGFFYYDINEDLIFENVNGEWYFADDEVICWMPFGDLDNIPVE